MGDSPTATRDPAGKDVGRLFLHDVNRETLSDDKTLTNSDVQIHSLDPAAARDLTLPAEEEGLMFIVANRSDGAEDITVKNDAGTTLGTISEDECAWLISDGTGWLMLLGAAATAQT